MSERTKELKRRRKRAKEKRKVKLRNAKPVLSEKRSEEQKPAKKKPAST